MMVVRVELHSAITGRVTEIARMRIANDGSGSRTVGNYVATVFRGRSKAELDKSVQQRAAGVKAYPRLKLHVWNLVAEALAAMNYGRKGTADDR